MRLRPITSILFFSTLLLARAAGADPTDPVTIVPAPEGQGAIFSPGVRLVADLEPAYVEEEFFVSGAATVFNYATNPPVRGDIVPVDEDVPYTTRIIIRRPLDPTQFNGTLIVEWWNSTATFDTAPVWDPSAEYFAREGIVYVGVTNSNTSIAHLVGGCRLASFFPPTCGIRYASLSLPENGQAYEMVSQIANLLKGDSPENPLHPDYPVERLFHAGQSQQGGSMVTYASAFHFPVNDGYFVQAASTARPINFGPECGEPNSPPFPDCTPRLEGEQRLVRTDLPVPVYRALTETDVVRASGETRQDDTETFRYYEMTGTAHVTVHEDVEVIPNFSLEDFCLLPLNTLADGPVKGSFLYNAMWRNMEWQVRDDDDDDGIDPPHGDLIEIVDGQIVLDEFGNAVGGIRLPALDVPIATYGPSNSIDPSLPPIFQPLGGLFCVLSGTVTAFDRPTLDELYPTHKGYVAKVGLHAAKLVLERFLLIEDFAEIIHEAAQSNIGARRRRCGLGFELAFLLPPLMWLHRRRRRVNA